LQQYFQILNNKLIIQGHQKFENKIPDAPPNKLEDWPLKIEAPEVAGEAVGWAPNNPVD